MANSTGASVQVTYIEEVTLGTTPVTPQTTVIPVQSCSLDLKRDVLEDNSILADGQKRYMRLGNNQVSGSMEVSLAHSTFDKFLESALYGTWATNVLKLGTTQSSVSLEIGYTDIAQYAVHTGVVVNSLQIDVTPNAVTKATFGLIAMGQSFSASPLDATPTAASTTKQPLVHFGGTIKEGGATIATITSMTLNVTNNSEPNFALCDSNAKSVTRGDFEVKGQITAYFPDLALYNKYKNETTSSIEIGLTDGTNTLTILVPKVKYDDHNVPVSNSKTLLQTLSFAGLFDSTEATALKLTRS